MEAILNLVAGIESVVLTFLAHKLQDNTIVGFIIGYALKKIIKILVIITGSLLALELLAIGYLESIGAITVTVNTAKITTMMTGATTWARNFPFSSPHQLTGGLAAGIAIGFSKG